MTSAPHPARGEISPREIQVPVPPAIVPRLSSSVVNLHLPPAKGVTHLCLMQFVAWGCCQGGLVAWITHAVWVGLAKNIACPVDQSFSLSACPRLPARSPWRSQLCQLWCALARLPAMAHAYLNVSVCPHPLCLHRPNSRNPDSRPAPSGSQQGSKSRLPWSHTVLPWWTGGQASLPFVLIP